MKQRELLMVLALGICSIQVNAQSRKLKTERNGYQWYSIKSKEGKEGAEGKDGSILIPLNRGYDFICYICRKNVGWFSVSRNGKEGACDITGKEIIVPEKYDFVYFLDKEGYVGYYSVEMNGKEGVCDITGKEIIPCRYENIIYYDGFEYANSDNKYIAMGIKLDSQGMSYGSGLASSSSSSSSSSSTSRSSSRTSSSYNSGAPERSNSSSDLRYKGLYTISSQGRSQTYGGYTGIAGSDLETEIEIYDDYIMVGTTKCTFDKVSGGERAYSSKGWGVNGWHTYSTYYVDSNYNIRRVDTSSGQFGTDWFEYEVAKGRCTMPKYQPQFSGSSASGGGGSTYGSGNSTYNQNQTGKKVRTACRSCMYTNGKCSVCKGTGRQRTSAAGYSTTTECRNCGGSGRCPTCGGDGWIN